LAAFFISAFLFSLANAATPTYYSNATLTSKDGNLEVVVYLPIGIKQGEKPYYVSSRFEHGSMIGSIKRKAWHNVDGEVVEKDHYLFGGNLWRIPHNSYFPESGIGLASEFGVGDDGAFCYFRCGWNGVNDITNGLLGYDEARLGEPFLKIGVGALIKGICTHCDSTENYKFNSPYEFAELPKWTILEVNQYVVSMETEARVGDYGYRLHKDIVLQNDELLITSILTNLGTQAFSTAWYSHNFFTCDDVPVGKDYSVDLQIRGQRGRLYDEPGVIGSWATPLQAFATVQEFPDHVSIDVNRALDDSSRIKAEFTKDSKSNGEFALYGCDTIIKGDFPEVMRGELSMYGYNLYLEKGTLSPEPQLLIDLQAGQSKSWTQRLTIKDKKHPFEERTSFGGTFQMWRPPFTKIFSSENFCKLGPAFMIVAIALSAAILSNRAFADGRRRRENYSQVPDVS